MSKKTNDELRAKYVQILNKLLTEAGEETLTTGSNEIAIPVVDSEGEDQYIVFTVKVPTGSRDGEAYDGYAEAENYKHNQEEKAKKAEAAAIAKQKKIARDQKIREQKAAAKAAREQEATA